MQGDVDLTLPRDRAGTFYLKVVNKHQKDTGWIEIQLISG